MKIEELKAKALEELKNNDELFVYMVEELDAWNGYADGFRCYYMSEIDVLFCDCKVSEFLDKLASGFNLNDEFMVDTIYGLDSTNDRTAVYRENVWEAELLDNIIENAHGITFYNEEFENLINEIIEIEEQAARLEVIDGYNTTTTPVYRVA